MSRNAQRKLLQDLERIKKNNDEGINAVPDEDNLMLWEAVIYGPNDTIWEGGTFRLQIEFEDDYPQKPPKLQFRTKLFHPNIYNEGKICIDSTNLAIQSYKISGVTCLISFRFLHPSDRCWQIRIQSLPRTNRQQNCI
jgi:ubiquitin-protein ligase